MPLQKKDRALLIKLFYQNGSNSLVALRAYHRLKVLQKKSMWKNVLKKMIMKFEVIGDVRLLPEKERKSVANKTIEGVVTAAVERTSSFSYSSTSGRSVSRKLEIR